MSMFLFIGLRRCAGIEIARQELFLYFVGILQKFDIQKPDDVKSIPEDPIVGLTLSPHPYKVVLRPKFWRLFMFCKHLNFIT